MTGTCALCGTHAPLLDSHFMPRSLYQELPDSHDLVYCIEHGPSGWEAAATAFRDQLAGRHEATIRQCLGILRKRFLSDEQTEAHLKDGPTMVANFELGESGTRENRILRQRDVAAHMEKFLNALTGSRCCSVRKSGGVTHAA